MPVLKTEVSECNQPVFQEERQQAIVARTALLYFLAEVALRRFDEAHSWLRIATITGCVILVAVLLAPNAALATDSDGSETPQRVVILNATDPYLPAFQVFERALRAAIVSNSASPVELYGETLDMHRFPHALLEKDIARLLKRKYHDLKIDVVVTIAPVALDFALRYRDETWPGADIVFNIISPKLLDERNLAPDVIGLPHRLEFVETLDLALRLRPQTQTIAIVGDIPRACCEFLAPARAAIKRLEARVDTQLIIGLSTAETLAAVEALPPDAIVLYLAIYRDLDGQPQVPRVMLERLSKVSPVPIFGVFETYLGHGILAGSIASFGVQGRKTGQMVARVLNGEDPAAIGIQPPVAPSCMADWRQLRRWDIDPDLLPEGCEIRFRELGVWDQYRQQILLVLGVILAQAGWILALMRNQRRLRKTQAGLEAECKRRKTAESLAAQLRGRLARVSKERGLGTMAAAIVHEIDQPITAILNYAQATKRRLQGDRESKAKSIELLGKIEGQAERAGSITQRVRSLVSSGEPQLEPVPLYPLLEAVIRMIEPEIESRSCHIRCSLTGEAPTVLADPLQVQLVLVNLIQNATQSLADDTDTGADKEVSVDLGYAGKDQVEVSVTDHGPGVPPERVGDIFEHFYSEKRGGMGMGLSIARTIVEAHGGKIWHEPNPTGGAIFRFTLRATAR
ncbi:sensor histidine kinase [Thiorhodovibrio frisius]|uniref:histidine kinase n=1 Tax=Thiorhodovibrio frisius TaxID=631362 RepID=H8Z740_9GAMM|nr:ATP-binding protein [Thiorhodovibrio frisius]EIC20839.1 histidine kinase [Thiorhodovibrio frisius]WPL21891.1 Sensor protein FixL [Thiorhodovibrio frisius]